MSVPNATVVTNQGECKIHITLDLNLNLAGGVVNVESVKSTAKKDPEKVDWAIPDFATDLKLDFGKKEGQ